MDIGPQTLTERSCSTTVLSLALVDSFHKTMFDRGCLEALIGGEKRKEHHGQRKWMKNRKLQSWEETGLAHVSETASRNPCITAVIFKCPDFHQAWGWGEGRER